MIQKLDKVRAGVANHLEAIIWTMDIYWFRCLDLVHRWTIRRARAHCQREKLRRFRQLMAWSCDFLN